jgi:hypothetical protein
MRRLLLAVPLALLVSGCGTALTPDRLSPSFSTAFAGLYVSQQALLGRAEVTRSELAALSSCRRSGPDQRGPGEDWLCTVQLVDAGTSAAQTFEVQLKADGCWKADGPPSVQPAQLVDAVSGAPRTNPLAEFDGCLDPSW